MRVLINILFAVIAFQAFASPTANAPVAVPDEMMLSEVVSAVIGEVPTTERAVYDCKAPGVIYVDSNEWPGEGAIVYTEGDRIYVRKSNINECLP